MSFSPLETLLIALFFGILSAIVEHFFLGRKFMTREECAAYHSQDDDIRSDVEGKIDELNRKHNVVFRMVRGLVIYSNINETEKERLLNDRGADNG